MKEKIIEMLGQKPDYIEVLKDLLKLHDSNPMEGRSWMEGDNRPAEAGWEWGVHYSLNPGKLSYLVGENILVKWGSNKTKIYGLRDPEAVREALEYVDALGDGADKQVFTDADIPDDLFDVISGFDNAKKLFLMSIRAETATNILMVGPSATAKTVFLEEINRLRLASMVYGGLSTKAGIREKLIEERPRFFILDEVDELDRKDWAVLLGLMESGTIIDTRYHSRREIHLNCRVYMATNNPEKIPDKVMSRFGKHKLYFKEYSRSEYEDIVFNVLTKRYNKDETLAMYIAEIISKESKDVRDAISIAKLAKTKDDVDVQLAIIEEYAEV